VGGQPAQGGGTAADAARSGCVPALRGRGRVHKGGVVRLAEPDGPELPHFPYWPGRGDSNNSSSGESEGSSVTADESHIREGGENKDNVSGWRGGTRRGHAAGAARSRLGVPPHGWPLAELGCWRARHASCCELGQGPRGAQGPPVPPRFQAAQLQVCASSLPSSAQFARFRSHNLNPWLPQTRLPHPFYQHHRLSPCACSPPLPLTLCRVSLPPPLTSLCGMAISPRLAQLLWCPNHSQVVYPIDRVKQSTQNPLLDQTLDPTPETDPRPETAGTLSSTRGLAAPWS
jgi:hypothetical protein